MPMCLPMVLLLLLLLQAYSPAYVMSLSLHCCGVISSCRYSSSRQGGPMWMPVYLHGSCRQYMLQAVRMDTEVRTGWGNML